MRNPDSTKNRSTPHQPAMLTRIEQLVDEDRALHAPINSEVGQKDKQDRKATDTIKSGNVRI